jgi:hypothetical protein
MTEIPRRRRPLKKGELLGRQTTYRDFSIVHVDSSVSNKTNRQWKEEGRQVGQKQTLTETRNRHLFIAHRKKHLLFHVHIHSTNGSV